VDVYPWVTPTIRRLIRKRDRIWKKSRKDERYRDRAKAVKHQLQKEMRQAYWTHLETILTPGEEAGEHRCMKKFWSFIKHSRKDNIGVSSLREGGILTSDAKEKANILNRQFESVFTCDTEYPAELKLPDGSFPVMRDIEITQPGVLKLLQQLNVHKAPGPDGISPRVLKELSHRVAPMLTMIFKKSYLTGTVPKDWRQAYVTPIYKKGNKNDASNYRPVSLTCIACKLMEHIITSNLMGHARTHKILYELQHGFRDRRSCETQLLEFTADITNNMQCGQQTDILIMDFSKAFDKVSHTRLILKLHHYGVQGRTNAWIQAFLGGREQQVVLDGEYSYSAEVRSGVPQGSVIGPCLFLYYINDIHENLTSSVRLFADDTLVYLTIRSDSDRKVLQCDLDHLAAWEARWKMAFHPEKCQVLRITRKRKPLDTSYVLHGHILEVVSEAKYLGVLFTKDLTWGRHISCITGKANRTLGFLRRNLRINSPELKTTAYISLVRPLVEYAATVWDPYTDKDVKEVEKIQRRAARYVLNRNHQTSSVESMITQLQWTSLKERRRQARLYMMYKIQNNLVAVDKDRYVSSVPRTSRRTTNVHALYAQQSTKDYHLKSFFPRTIRDWNNLPSDTVTALTLEEFKSRVAGF